MCHCPLPQGRINTKRELQQQLLKRRLWKRLLPQGVRVMDLGGNRECLPQTLPYGGNCALSRCFLGAFQVGWSAISPFVPPYGGMYRGSSTGVIVLRES